MVVGCENNIHRVCSTKCKPIDLWTYGPMDLWTYGPVDLWSSEPVDPCVLWTCGLWIVDIISIMYVNKVWTCGPVDLWDCGPMDL